MRKGIVIVVSAVIVLSAIGIIVRYKLLRQDVPQPAWIAANQQNEFLYGSVGVERDAGIPYWIWLSLPRMFPEHMPGNGGYISLGFSWEQGIEMPAGFAKKTVGYIRVGGNCALCHAASYRKGPDEGPEVIPFVPGHVTDDQALRAFLQKCAQDQRFNATEILTEVGSATKLSWADWLLYKFYLIPRTRKRLSENPVLIDSVLQRHKDNPHSDVPFSEAGEKAFEWLKSYRLPQYPLPWDSKKAEDGRRIFAQSCSECHAPNGKRKGTVIPIAEIETDPNQAGKANAAGYIAGTLDGIWARGPYLHNHSVPTIAALLSSERPASFYSGNNLIDPQNVGFVWDKEQDSGVHFAFYNTQEPGKNNGGHNYGTELSKNDKEALLEYLKTL